MDPLYLTDGDDEEAFTDTKAEILDQLKQIKDRTNDMVNALRIKRSTLPHDRPLKMDDVISAWLNQSYNTTKYGRPCWNSLIIAVADDNGGANKALANRLAKAYPRMFIQKTIDNNY